MVVHVAILALGKWRWEDQVFKDNNLESRLEKNKKKEKKKRGGVMWVLLPVTSRACS